MCKSFIQPDLNGTCLTTMATVLPENRLMFLPLPKGEGWGEEKGDDLNFKTNRFGIYLLNRRSSLRHRPFTFAKALFVLLASLLLINCARAADPVVPPEDAQREQAIADFTQKMKAANYPALFDKAAQEFNVPADILKAVSFAETRWSQLEWPAGETVSPDTGMPRAYGIMSLWDNDYFGHSLLQAAQLIGQDPETLKTDAYQNMRGGAALLRQIYDQTPKPSDAPDESAIESWRKALAKYTGIPQPELSEAHALRVYEYMNLGYNQYGIKWDAHPVNLEPMRADVARIKAEALAHQTGQTNEVPATNVVPPALKPEPLPQAKTPPPVIPPVIAAAPAPHAAPDNSANKKQRPILLGLMLILIVIAAWYLSARKSKVPPTR